MTWETQSHPTPIPEDGAHYVGWGWWVVLAAIVLFMLYHLAKDHLEDKP